MASAHLRWTATTARHRKQNLQVLFIDIKSAYYSVFHDMLCTHKHDTITLTDLLDQV